MNSSHTAAQNNQKPLRNKQSLLILWSRSLLTRSRYKQRNCDIWKIVCTSVSSQKICLFLLLRKLFHKN